MPEARVVGLSEPLRELGVGEAPHVRDGPADVGARVRTTGDVLRDAGGFREEAGVGEAGDAELDDLHHNTSPSHPKRRPHNS